MEEKIIKPKLVFFQGKHSKLPKFQQHHLQLHVQCLQEFFDVVLVNEDCDYDKVCEKYQPDLTLFEGGWKSVISEKLKIKNTSAHPYIPKLGFHNGDGWCECRVSFFSDMDRWGIENFVSISTTVAEHTPAMAENVFVWPNFIDERVYKDYHLARKTPVLFTGCVNSLYPWRQKVFKLLSSCYPSAAIPHLGYDKPIHAMKYGEVYARLINTSWFVPTCGTVAKEFVRKHLEIPGCKSCLITEKTPFLEAAGFVDMQNCVFADENDLLDKLDYLIKNRGDLDNIIEAGFSLVHSRHTLKQRDQILQWFTLHKQLKPNQKIIQQSPFERLKVAESFTAVEHTPMVCNGHHLTLLHKGDEKLWMGQYEEAEELFMRSLSYISWMSETNLKLGICNLYMGKVDKAMDWICRPLQNQLLTYKSDEPDPIEWAYFMISLLCKGKLKEAALRASQFPSLTHPELDRARLIVQYLMDQDKAKVFAQHNVSTKYRRSVHQLPAVAFEQWVNNVIVMLKACNQQEYALVLSTLFAPPGISLRNNQQISFNKYLIKAWAYSTEKINGVFKTFHIPETASSPSIFPIDYLKRIARYLKLNLAVLRLYQLKNKITSLHSPSTEKTEDKESDNPIHNIFETACPSTVLLIGASAIDCVGKTFVQKKQQNIHAKFFYLDLSISDNQFSSSPLTSYEFTPASLSSFSMDLNECIRKVKRENRIDQFDVVCLDSTWLFQNELMKELELTRFLIISSTCAEHKNNSTQVLSDKHNYQLLSRRLSAENGYTIFKNDSNVLSSVSSV